VVGPFTAQVDSLILAQTYHNNGQEVVCLQALLDFKPSRHTLPPSADSRQGFALWCLLSAYFYAKHHHVSPGHVVTGAKLKVSGESKRHHTSAIHVGTNDAWKDH